MRKIAPNLKGILAARDQRPSEFDPEWTDDARKELRALLAVIRVVQKQGPLVSTEWDMKLGRALARLDKLSGGGK